MAFDLSMPQAVVNALPVRKAGHPPNNNIRELINAHIEKHQSTALLEEAGQFRICTSPPIAKAERRRYLGGSQIGGDCGRARWYSFHWGTQGKGFKPNTLRLFERGHLEEARFIKWLTMIGCKCREHDPKTIPILWHHPESDDYFVTLPGQTEYYDQGCDDVTGTFHEWIARSRGVKIPEPRQFSWIDIDGHHLGNCDGDASNVPGVERFGLSPDTQIMLEFKTHNDKSFVDVVENGVYQAKLEHFHQVQSYMNHLEYPLTLYGAVNKNNDDLYFEFIPREHGLLEDHRTRANEAIYSEKPPKRVSNSPAWFACKWCDFRPNCHYGAPLDKNCRTCVFSRPVADGNWLCRNYNKIIPRDFEALGCGNYNMRTD